MIEEELNDLLRITTPRRPLFNAAAMILLSACVPRREPLRGVYTPQPWSIEPAVMTELGETFIREGRFIKTEIGFPLGTGYPETGRARYTIKPDLWSSSRLRVHDLNQPPVRIITLFLEDSKDIRTVWTIRKASESTPRNTWEWILEGFDKNRENILSFEWQDWVLIDYKVTG